MDLSKDKMLEMYRAMQRIRHFEAKIRDLATANEIPGFVHVSIGEEASAAGVCAALRQTDFITSTHRGHGHLIAKGGRLDRMMAEIYGKRGGYCKGKGGSMHIVDFSLGILGANGIVGAGLPIATGSALAAQVLGRGDVTACFFGDGASNEGTFHESLNIAAVWKLPVVFVCENNGFGEFTPMHTVTSVRDIAVRAKAYDMPGFTIDGNDVLEVFKYASEAVARARDPLAVRDYFQCVRYRRNTGGHAPRALRPAADAQEGIRGAAAVHRGGRALAKPYEAVVAQERSADVFSAFLR